jgi:putative spermidine/putrescine transport system substrate-binding protein
MAQGDEGVVRPEARAYDRRRFLRQAGLGAAAVAAGGVLFDAGASSASPFVSRAVRKAAVTAPKMPPGLVAAAQKEGTLNLIADPPNWANYGTQSTPNTVIGEFYNLYKINCPVTNPLGTSAQELTAILSFKGTSKEPDAVDVSPEIADQAASEGAFEPYKVQTWGDIPAALKEPNGAWTGDYYGVTSFGTNTKVVKNPPKSWKDLLKPEYKGQVAIDNSPAVAGDAFGAVWSAALANGGSLDNIMPGLEFFKKLKDIGNFNPVDCHPAQIASGETPIAIVWDYLNIGYSKQYPDIKYVVSIPTDAKFANFYCQAISKYATHPNAAKLWMEYLYSDLGQLEYLAGYVHPARYTAMAAAGKIPASLAKKLPPASEYAGLRFPTLAQINKASAIVLANWDKMVGGV